MGIIVGKKKASRLKNTFKWILFVAVIVLFFIAGTIEHDPFGEIEGTKIEVKSAVMRYEAKPVEKEVVAKKSVSIPSGDCYRGMKQVFPEYLWATASDIISRESSGVATAVSPTNDHGCFQINKGLAIYGTKIYDPVFNAKVAYNQKYLKGGWRHWMCCPEYW